MTKTPISNSKDFDSQDVLRALMRASEKARKLAEQTGTPFVVRQPAKPIATADREMLNRLELVAPAKAGAQSNELGVRLRGHDDLVSAI